jgi:predicted secreted protein
VHRVWRKLLWTTVTAAVVFGIAAAVYKAGLIPLEFLKQISNPPHS